MSTNRHMHTESGERVGDRAAESDKVSNGASTMYLFPRAPGTFCSHTLIPSTVAIWSLSPFFLSFAQQKSRMTAHVSYRIVYRLQYNIEALLKSLLFWWSIFHSKISVWLFLPAETSKWQKKCPLHLCNTTNKAMVPWRLLHCVIIINNIIIITIINMITVLITRLTHWSKNFQWAPFDGIEVVWCSNVLERVYLEKLLTLWKRNKWIINKRDEEKRIECRGHLLEIYGHCHYWI